MCLRCGPVAVVLFGLGVWVLARLLPPPSPASSADAVVALYRGNTTGLRLGVLMMQVAGALLGPWVAAITTRLKRIEGADSPLTYTNLGSRHVDVDRLRRSADGMQTAAFRLDRQPELIQALHDLGWLSFIGIFSFPSVQCLAMAFCKLSDPAQQVLPRRLERHRPVVDSDRRVLLLDGD